MKTTIVIEDGRVSIQVDDGEPVLVQSAISEKPVSDTPQLTSTIADTPPAPAKKPINAGPPPEKPTINATATCLNCGDAIRAGSKYCKKPECKKAQTKANNDRYRLAKGLNVGGGRGRKKHNAAGQFEMEAKDDTPPLWKDAPPAEPVYRSNCCDAVVEVSGGEDEPDEGGTRFYVCRGCGQTCDVHELPFEDPWDCGACRANGRLCRLHHVMDAEGKTPPAVRHQV